MAPNHTKQTSNLSARPKPKTNKHRLNGSLANKPCSNGGQQQQQLAGNPIGSSINKHQLSVRVKTITGKCKGVKCAASSSAPADEPAVFCSDSDCV